MGNLWKVAGYFSLHTIHLTSIFIPFYLLNCKLIKLEKEMSAHKLFIISRGGGGGGVVGWLHCVRAALQVAIMYLDSWATAVKPLNLWWQGHEVISVWPITWLSEIPDVERDHGKLRAMKALGIWTHANQSPCWNSIADSVARSYSLMCTLFLQTPFLSLSRQHNVTARPGERSHIVRWGVTKSNIDS